ncbi:putative lipid II flippase FtsW [Pedosphaera parvula]|uniref:Probable peptidoglycan glycosyltransferase FtsW n=1 Tax=Pedosphaera parvula (strain Ellin514) TaxID=320771 RepID=B9XIG7_PEDPL|nr:putative lipid II flippase FtsW [Pedosphaera parvula]EEF60428.1 cell cycle protein [Pedosphaera parvula Ellin514]
MKLATTALVFCVAALLALGMVMLYSSSMADKGMHYLIMQCLWGSVGLVSCVIAACVDYRLLKKLAWPILIFSIVLLVFVLAGPANYAPRINGARRWLNFHGFRFEPSELAKLALIIAVAWYGDHFQRKMHTFKNGIVLPGIMIGFVLAFIFVEPDRGTTILMAGVTGIMLVVCGARLKFIVPPGALALAAFGFSLLYDPMRRARMLAWLHPEEHKMDIGYQANQAMLALGAGGWTGVGLGNSRQKLGFLPEHHTDFILAIVGEELGLVATLLVVLTFIIIIACGLYIAGRSSDTFGLLLASGLTSLIGLQAVINVGVVTNTLPNKGLPLPFISYGGSNLLMMLTAIGLLVSVARKARPVNANVSETVEADAIPSPQLS